MKRPQMSARNVTALVILALCVALLAAVLLISHNARTAPHSAVEVQVSTSPSSPSTEHDRPPAIAENGQVDIGGPGIPANVDGVVDPAEPEATPDPETGLAPWPAEVPLADLTTPMLPGVPVGECASPASVLGRAMGNAIVAYLFTWDTTKTSFADWVAPIEREWSRTAGFYGGEGSDGKYGAYTFADRLAWLDLTPEAWSAFEADHANSEVRVNAVTTAMSGKHNLQLVYTVTVTRSGADGLSVSSTRDVEIWLTAPCPHDDYGIAGNVETDWDLTGLQFWDEALCSYAASLAHDCSDNSRTAAASDATLIAPLRERGERASTMAQLRTIGSV
ncbi:hypothetical protein [Agromyces aerolatus]|uniref:hypothetical protein n=1 Tax=Agromyces sp. LY-1074 TaxID=3074080 RepID=UPI00285BB1B4|nr:MULTISPECIES: hypothetical protein [unclassified Agromyces]MDR5700961.1 hypothetical protein [Agromyces sp. LY-1074]MDR5707378.1 hypothetical protein [Agromyces sp. LY-1358]